MASSRNFLIKFGADSKSVTQAIRQITTGTRNATNLAKSAADAFKFTGDASGVTRALEQMRSQLTETEKYADKLRSDLAEGIATGKITEGSAKYNQMASAITKADTQANRLKSSIGQSSQAIGKTPGPSKFSGIGNALKSAGSHALSFTKSLDSSKIDAAAGSLKRAGGAAASFVGNLGANAVSSAVGAITGSLGGIGKAAMDNADAMVKFQSTMKFGGATAKETNQASKAMKAYADETVYDTNDVMSTTAKLQASGVKNYQGLTKAAGNLNAVAGGNADTFKSVTQMLTQTAGAGKLTTENWDQLRDAIPGASGIIQKALKQNGAYTGNFSDAMAKGQISSDEFNKAITQLGMNPGAVKAAKSTKTFEGAMGNLQSTAANAGQKIIDAIGMGNITGAIDSFGQAIDKASTFVAPFFGKFVSGLKQMTGGKNKFDIISGVFTSLTKQMQDFAGSPVFKQIKSSFSSIFGNISGMAKQIGGAFSSSLPGVVTLLENFAGIFSDVLAKAVGGFTKSLPGILDLLGQLGTIVGGALTTAFEGLDQMMPTIMTIFGQVGKIVGTIVLGAFKAIAGLIPTLIPIYNAIGNAFSSILGFITPVVNIIMNILVPIFMQLAQMIAPLLVTAINGIGAVFKTLAPYITAAGAKIQEIWNIIKPFVAQLVNALKPAISGIVSVAKSLASILGTALNAALSIVISLFKSPIFQFFLNILIKIVGWVGNLIKGFANMLKNALPALMSFLKGIGSFLSSVIGEIGKLPGQIWNGIKSIGGFLGRLVSGWIKDAINNAKAEVAFYKSLPGRIWNAMKGIGNIGANLVKGLWNGIKGMGKWIGDKLKGFGKGVTGQLKKFFGIHSPSTVMRDEIGKYLVMGIGKGIDTYADEAVKPMNALKQQLTGSMGDVDLGSPSYASLATANSGAYQQSQAGVAGGITFNINGATQNTANEVRRVLRQEGLTK